MKYEFVPWTSYADRFLNELNSKGKLCDLIIGDSQWIGGAAEEWSLRQAQRFLRQRKNLDGRFHAGDGGRLFAMAEEYPKLLGAAGDGRRDRLDLSQGLVRPARNSGRVSRRNTNATSARLKPGMELKQIAEFFQGREIDGKKVYGAYIYTERGSEGITMGVTNALYDWGFQYDDPKKPYQMEGFVNSPDAVKGLEFYKRFTSAAPHPDEQRLHVGGLDAFKSGQVAMQMNFFASFLGSTRIPTSAATDRLLRQSEAEVPLHPVRRTRNLGRLLLGAQGRRARLHQMVR